MFYLLCYFRLYCHSVESETRLGAVFVLNELLNNVVLVLAPVLPHLAEEVYFFQPLRKSMTWIDLICSLMMIAIVFLLIASYYQCSEH